MVRLGHSFIAAASLAALLAAGCAGFQQPDFAALYGHADAVNLQPPVVIIPGLMGSRLAEPSGREIWPGPLTRLLFSNYADLGDSRTTVDVVRHHAYHAHHAQHVSAVPACTARPLASQSQF